jgi:lambda repressor-like predicted transcriptional regulator
MHPEEIKAALRMRRVTQVVLAEELKVAPSSINQTISGRIRSERIQARISQLLEKPIEEIWPEPLVLRRNRKPSGTGAHHEHG